MLVRLVLAPHIEHTEDEAAHQDHIASVDPRVHLKKRVERVKVIYKYHDRIEKEHEDKLWILLFVKFLTCFESVEQKHHGKDESHAERPCESIGRDQSPDLKMKGIIDKCQRETQIS